MKPAHPCVVRANGDTAAKQECDNGNAVKRPNPDSIALNKGAKKKPGQKHAAQAWWSSRANPNNW